MIWNAFETHTFRCFKATLLCEFTSGAGVKYDGRIGPEDPEGNLIIASVVEFPYSEAVVGTYSRGVTWPSRNLFSVNS